MTQSAIDPPVDKPSNRPYRELVRVFIDVGAHYGETLDVALDPAWHFDRIHLVEPASACQPVLHRFRDPRIRIHPVALAGKGGEAPLFGAGLLGASLFEQKQQKSTSANVSVETVALVRASDWFRENIPEASEVFLKFNCEGAECDIIQDCLAAGLGRRIDSVYIDFDIRKVAGQEHRQLETETQLQKAGVRYCTSESLGSSANRAVAQWLSSECTREPAGLRDRLRYQSASYAPPYAQAKMLARSLLPRGVYWWLGHRFGRLSRLRRARRSA